MTPDPRSSPAPRLAPVPTTHNALNRWYAGLPRSQQALLALPLTVVIVAALALCALSANHAPVTAAHQSPPVATTPANMTLTGATLGGLPAALLAAYPDQTVTISGATASIDGSADTGTDGQQRITSITFTPQGRWTSARAAAVIAPFLPPDSALLRVVAAHGRVYHVYSSAQLKATFDASEFITESGAAAPAGSLSWNCDTAFTTCFLAPGTP